MHKAVEGMFVDFDVTKHVRLVPDFDDTDVDRYFLHFETSSSKHGLAKE